MLRRPSHLSTLDARREETRIAHFTHEAASGEQNGVSDAANSWTNDADAM